jgi:L-ascorbate metabolism protein UlaG (beta-lactamase superfamily)
MANRLTWLGHSTVLIDLDGTRVLTDPVLRRRVAHLIRARPVAARAFEAVDVVAVSHAHWDHLHIRSLEQVGREVPVVVPQGAGKLLSRRGFVNVVEVVEGSELELGSITLRATHAEHDAGRGPFGVDAPALGYVLAGSQSVYFAGDTDLFDGMSGLVDGLDVALMPIAGWGPRLPPGHLDPESAAEAVRLLRPRRAIPVHWGTYRPLHRRVATSSEAAAARFAARVHELAPGVDVQVLRIGESCGI